MSRRLPEELEGKELAPLCLASTLNEAKQIESVLDGAGTDYTFEITPLRQQSVFSILFGGRKEGVLFLVPSEKLESCRRALMEAGLPEVIIGDDEQ